MFAKRIAINLSVVAVKRPLVFFLFFWMTWSFFQSRWKMWTHDILTHFQGFWLLASPCNPAALTRRHLLNAGVLISSFFSLLKPATSLISCPCSCLYTKSFWLFFFFFFYLNLVRLFLPAPFAFVCVPLLRASLSARLNTHPATSGGVFRAITTCWMSHFLVSTLTLFLEPAVTVTNCAVVAEPTENRSCTEKWTDNFSHSYSVGLLRFRRDPSGLNWGPLPDSSCNTEISNF